MTDDIERRHDAGLIRDIKISIIELSNTINHIDKKVAVLLERHDTVKTEIRECKEFRSGITTKTDDTNKCVAKLKSEQGSVMRLLCLIGIAITGLIGKIIYKLFGTN